MNDIEKLFLALPLLIAMFVLVMCYINMLRKMGKKNG